MAVLNPLGWLQNAGATHTAAQMRSYIGGLLGINRLSTSLVPRGGVNPGFGNQLSVTQTGSPSMAVIVKSGIAVLPGTEGSTQGGYPGVNDADVTLSIAAAHASLARIDIVVFKVEDSQYSGATNAGSLVVVTGTPAGSPVAPAAPNNSITLAQVAVGAGVTSITNANITDTRIYVTGAGGIMPVSTLTERNGLTGLYEGFAIYRFGGDRLQIWDGVEWRTHGGRPTQDTVTTSQTTTSTSYAALATAGPLVSLECDERVEVTISCRMRNSGVNLTRMSFAVSGATTVAADDSRALEIESTGWMRASATTLVLGLNAGTNTFTAQYKVAAGTGTFEDRRILVRPL